MHNQRCFSDGPDILREMYNSGHFLLKSCAERSLTREQSTMLTTKFITEMVRESTVTIPFKHKAWEMTFQLPPFQAELLPLTEEGLDAIIVSMSKKISEDIKDTRWRVNSMTIMMVQRPNLAIVNIIIKHF